jgi:hypothetical protein
VLPIKLAVVFLYLISSISFPQPWNVSRGTMGPFHSNADQKLESDKNGTATAASSNGNEDVSRPTPFNHVDVTESCESAPLMPADSFIGSPDVISNAKAHYVASDLSTHGSNSAVPSNIRTSTEHGDLTSSSDLPLHLTEKVKQSGTFTSGLSRWTDAGSETWIWELCAVMISLAATVSICGVLLAYNGKSVPQLPFDVTVSGSTHFRVIY